MARLAFLALVAALLAASHTADAFTAPAAVMLRAPSRPLVSDRCARVLPRRRNASRDSPPAAVPRRPQDGARERRAAAAARTQAPQRARWGAGKSCVRVRARRTASHWSAALSSARPATSVMGRTRHACAHALEGPGRPIAHDVPLCVTR